MKALFLYRGPVHSGKTSRLRSWVTNMNASGILAPIIAGKRYLLDIKTNEKRKLELNEGNRTEKVIEVGKYKFDQSVFEWGCEIILLAIKEKPEWIIIDEFGLLELNDLGLAKAIHAIINYRAENGDSKIIIVVRDSLIERFLNKYNLKESDVKRFSISTS